MGEVVVRHAGIVRVWQSQQVSVCTFRENSECPGKYDKITVSQRAKDNGKKMQQS